MSQHGYSFWSRFIHHMALNSNAVAEVSSDIDQMLFPIDDSRVVEKQHVFVTGLARAGTTILMRQLHATGAFRSLTYRDMPFVLAPNLWAKLSGMSRKDMVAEERAHGDGILVDFDSPEALEEVFWRVQTEAAYIREDRLVPMEDAPEAQIAFRRYVAALLRQHEGKCYLSKNNNNILRLQTLVHSFPNAAVIIPFREPLQHASSLLQQHQAFLKRHDEDPFSLKYMNWLVHHEFGQAHRPFVFNETGTPISDRGNPETDLEYWLQMWLETYAFIADTAPESCIFLSYERLCDEAQTVWPQICASLNLPSEKPADALRRSHHTVRHDAADTLVQQCDALYQKLREREIWR